MHTNKSFRAYDLGQSLLLPPDMNDWLPSDHLARFVADAMNMLNLDPFYAAYQDGRGLSAYHPQMMLSVLVYGYCTGVRSSRKLALACQENVAFRYLSGNSMPSHQAFANFRRRHLQAMHTLFVQIFDLCNEAGMVTLGHVSIDGSKIKADASKHKAVSWGRIAERQAHYRQIAESLTEQAETADAREDDQHGDDNDHTGSGLPAELQRAAGRLARLKKAQQALEERARRKAEQDCDHVDQRLKERAQQEAETGRKQRGRKPARPDPENAQPAEKDQYNFTDPDARIMLDGATKSFLYAYNAQICVDGANGVIVGTYLTDHANDKNELIPALAALHKNTDGKSPHKISADNGYYSKTVLGDSRLKDYNLYIPPNRAHRKIPVPDTADGDEHHHPPATQLTPSETMRHKLNTAEGKDVYKMRKAIAEAPFGIIKSVMGFRAFSLRGKAQVDGEWNLVTAAYNLRKLFTAGKRLTGA